MSDAEREQAYRFLMLVAELLHRNGTPSHRFERVMAKIAKSVGVVGVFLYTPTSVIAALGEGAGSVRFCGGWIPGPSMRTS